MDPFEFDVEINEEIEDLLILDYLDNGLRREIYERQHYFDTLDEASFRRRFRLSRQCVLNVLQLIEDQLEFPTDANNAVSPMNQLLVCLRYYSTGGHLQSIADLMGMHKSIVCRIVKKVTSSIASQYARFIDFQGNDLLLRKRLQDFFGIASFPRVVGAVDCTHIKIQSPGDSGYGIRKYLMTPLLNPITQAEQLYNESHIRTRNVIERCFGVLKRRFPILAYGCRLNVETVVRVIVAASILHNIAIDLGEEEPPPVPEELDEHVLNQLIIDGQIPEVGNNIGVNLGAGAALRRTFINNYFANL